MGDILGGWRRGGGGVEVEAGRCEDKEHLECLGDGAVDVGVWLVIGRRIASKAGQEEYEETRQQPKPINK